jgi:hypothetical protein
VIANCPGDIRSCSPVTAFVPPTATDNCNLLSFTRSQSITTTFSQITQSITYIATDESGNLDSCIFDIYQSFLPTADAGNDTTINSGDTLVLGGSPTASGGEPPYLFLWHDLTTGLFLDSIANPIIRPDTSGTFVVFVVDSNGCAATDQVTVTIGNTPQFPFKANSHGGFEISFYPNPAIDILTIRYVSANDESAELTIYNLLGRQVLNEKIAGEMRTAEFAISVAGWQNGLYFLKIKNDHSETIEKFVVIR